MARKKRAWNGDSFREQLEAQVIGQRAAVDAIVPVVRRHAVQLNPGGRPAGVFLLLGPTGTGKTRTVEAVAQALHGSPRNLLRVDCGEYSSDHEVAKLIGAPPGYLGHRETPAVLTQVALAASRGGGAGLAVVLFDEIEKGCPAFQRLLLGVLDKATLRIGSNAHVNFEDTVIFMTSNLGANQITELSSQRAVGFGGVSALEGDALGRRIGHASLRAARRFFSPEFMNRVDESVVFMPFDRASVERILDLEIAALQYLIDQRLGLARVEIHLARSARDWVIERGHDRMSGARELKRVLHRHVLDALVDGIQCGELKPGARVVFRAAGDSISYQRLRIAA